ncbi:MAG TPA: methyltransferase domain-containing protein [Verrucomicrobiae bacterium]|nr:methyltransferase domain-containing protein [Verrucomicrobiae bacterium]
MSLKLRIPSMARLPHICSRLFYRYLPTQARAGIISTFGSSWQSYCPACEDRVPGFSPLPDFYFQQLEEHGSDLHVTQFETINSNAYQCTHCGATDRDRLYALYLGDRLPRSEVQQTDFHLLDIAPSATLSRHIKRKYSIRYRTADLFQKGVDDRVDITSMTCYRDSSFDAFICSHVLEHVDNDRKAMGELFRVLKPGGWGIAMVPISTVLKGISEHPVKTAAERWKYFGQGDHVRLYSREGFVQRLQDAGFSVLQLGRDYFQSSQMVRCGLTESSILYVVEKPALNHGADEH